MDIRPFRGWRYAAPDGEVSRLIAPPYDVLSASDKDRLLAGSENNIVAVDLPHVPPKQLGPRSAYDEAARRLAGWQADGTLTRDAQPCLYVYEQAYPWAGRSHVRRALIAGVRATPFGQDVIPHEHVFGGPIADRMLLTEVTRMQLSPIFGFHEDPAGEVGQVLARTAEAPPALHGTLDGVTEKLWALDDVDTIRRVQQALRDVPAFIADGHHRYTTALDYRKRLDPDPAFGPDHEANFVMFALVAADDPGLVILPTHRMLSGLGAWSMDTLSARLPEFSWRRAGAAEPGEAGAAAIERSLDQAGPGAMALIAGESAELWIATLTDPAAMAEAAPEASDVWRSLPSAVVSKLIIEKGLGAGESERTAVEFTAHTAEAIAACRSGRADLAVCIQGISIDAVERIALSGASMPHKSTYFYPKIATGMVIKPLV